MLFCNIYIYIYIYIYTGLGYFIHTTISIEFTIEFTRSYQLKSKSMGTPDKRKAARDSRFVG